MPRLSLWRDDRHSNDFRFIDRRVSEMFQIGGVGVGIHKYLGPNSNANPLGNFTLGPVIPADIAGSNQKFKLPSIPENPSSSLLFLNGLKQIYGIENGYIINGPILIYNAAPQQDEYQEIYYSYNNGDILGPIVPTGPINSSNTTFTLPSTPVNPQNSLLFLNGLKQVYGEDSDYTIAGTTLTYNYPPQVGQYHEIYYCSKNSKFVGPAIPNGAINGSGSTGNTTFTLPSIPVNPEASLLFLNGLKQAYGSENDYTISGTTLMYNYPPQVGQYHEIYYGTFIDYTLPVYTNQSAQNIQDLLFLENRDRVYDPNIYHMRGIYHVQDLDLDLSQFGLILANGTIFITFHTISMVDTIGRKLMPGDVIELPNLKEFYALDESIPVALKRFYVVQDGIYPAEGYSQTWWSHLWRVKCTPMVNSEEFSQIINSVVTDTYGDPVLINGNTVTYGNIMSTADTYLNINDQIVAEAATIVPLSGYDTNPIYAPLFQDGDNTNCPLPIGSSPEAVFTGYLVGDGQPIDGYPYTSATAFPDSPADGTYILRTDFMPNRLFRFNAHLNIWQAAGNAVRTGLTPGTGQTQRDQFINNGNISPLNDLFNL